MTAAEPLDPAQSREFLGHPIGLLYLVFAEMFERFSYYGMRALLTLYLAQYLLQPGHIEHVIAFMPFRGFLEGIYGHQTIAGLTSIIVGLYGFTYLTPIAGGLIADLWLGRRATITIGALVMVAGHFLMAFDQSFLIALFLILAGVGCFKGNISSQVGGLYGPGDERRGTAFQIFYLVFNGAVIVAPIVCGFLGQKIGWSWGFGAAGVSMLFGLAVYLSGRKWLPPEPPRGNAAKADPMPPMTGHDGVKIVLLLVLLPLLGASLIGNEQIFNNYLTWGSDNYNLTFFGQTVPSSWLVSLDATCSVVFLSGSIAFWKWWSLKRREPDELTKIAFASLFAAVAPLAIAAAAMTVHPGHKASLWWAILFETFNDIGFANLVPVALALYARAAPKQVNGFMIGIYMMSFFFADMGAGALGQFMAPLGAVNFWLLHVAIGGGAAVGLILFWKLFNHLLLRDEPADKSF